MTTAKYPVPAEHFKFPDPPEQAPEDMTNFNQTNTTGNTLNLIKHLGNPDTTVVAGEHYISAVPTSDMTGLRFPDLFVSFNADPAAYRTRNGYVVSEQGKPPDFVLEIASRSTGRQDVQEKPADYAALGISEYWRFDETGEFHGARLAGGKLVDGRYAPIPIEELAGGALQGYSAVLDLFLRWDNGQLAWIDPATGQHIVGYDELLARAGQQQARAETAEAQIDRERTQVEQERNRAEQERARAEQERNARLASDARIRELEEQMNRMREQ